MTETAAPLSAARRHPLRVLLSLVSEEKGRVMRAVASSVINKVFDVMPEILIGIALDVVVRGKDSFVAKLGITEEEVIKNVMLKETVDGEFTTIEDVAETAVFFAAFGSNALTGQSIVVSHGWCME